MKFLKIFLLSGLILAFSPSFAQNTSSKVGFYFAPEYSAMFMENHVGNAIGYNIGLNLLQRKLSLGVRYIGRSGPFNEHAEFPLVLPEGTTYKGKTTLQLGADHAYFGLEAAYNHSTADGRWLIRVPASFGQLGAGFYLKGEDRETPDGRRVSEWEDQLMGGTDAGFGLAAEIGIQAYYQPFPNIPILSVGGGLHFSKTFGYESFLGGTDFYDDLPRASFGIIIRN